MKKHTTQTLVVSVILLNLVTGVFLGVRDVHAANIGKQVSNNGLVGWWTFDEGTSTVAHDFSGQGNHGTITNSPAWIVGKKGKALQFSSAANTSVKKTNVTTYNRTTGEELTVATWVKPNWGGAYQDLVANRSAGIHNWILYQHTTDGSIQLHGSAQNKSTYIPPNNVWTYIVATVDSAGNYNLYANGQVVQSTSFTYNLATPNELTIGNYGASSEPYNGSLDDVRIYSRALSASEITTLYKAGAAIKKNTSNNGLVGWWRFDEGTSTIAHDFSGSGNNGSFVSAPVWVNGKKGNALDFDGIDDYITTPVNRSSYSSITVSAWYKFEGNISDGYTALIAGQSADFFVGKNSGNSNIGVQDSAYNGALAVGTNAWDGGWHLMTYTFSGGTGTVYLDGRSVGSGAYTGGSGVIWIGQENEGPGYDFNGKIDDVRIYSRALSAAEVAALYSQNQTTVNASQNTKSTNGLIGLWSFDGKDMDWRSNKALDKSGNNNDGLLTNLPTTTAPTRGKIGQALSFDADSKYITSTNNTGLTGDVTVTVSAWIYPTNNTNAFQMIAGQAAADVAGRCINLILRTGKLSLDFCSGGYTQSATLATNRWYHVAAVKTQGLLSATTKLYVDGVDVTSGGSVVGGGDSTPSVTNSVITIGRFAPLAQHGFRGTIDDVRVYGRGLSAAEIKQLYIQGK